jgi:hypothetical protein
VPLDHCHPRTPQEKLRLPNGLVSSLMMDRALDAILRRAKTIDRKHDIPTSPATAWTARRSTSIATCRAR